MSHSDDRLKWIHRRKGVVACPVHLGGRSIKDPAYALAEAIDEALDPVKVPGKCRSLADMSPEERAEIERRYGAPIVVVDKDESVEVDCAITAVTEKAIRVKQRRPRGVEFTVAWLPRSRIDDAEPKVGPVVFRVPLGGWPRK